MAAKSKRQLATVLVDEQPSTAANESPIQAPLIVGSWTGKNEDEEHYGPSANAHLWNNSTAEWITNPKGIKLPQFICYNGCAYVAPYLYIFGGYDGNKEHSHGIPNAWKCNTETLTWEPIAPLNIRRLYIAGTNMGDHSCLAIGGSSGRNSKEITDYITKMNDNTFINNSGRMRAVEQYIIKENRWERLPNMIEARSDANACCHNNFIYVAGGFNGKTCLNSVEMYNPTDCMWTKLPNLQEKRSGLKLVIYQNSLIAIGGFGGRKTNTEDGKRRRKKRHTTAECLQLDEDGGFSGSISPTEDQKSEENKNYEESKTENDEDNTESTQKNLEDQVIERKMMSSLMKFKKVVDPKALEMGLHTSSKPMTVWWNSYKELVEIMDWKTPSESQILELMPSKREIRSLLRNEKKDAMEKKKKVEDFQKLFEKHWETLPSELNEGRSNFGACVINDSQIVVCGGFNEGTLKSCEMFDSDTGKWIGIQDLPVEMSAVSAVTINLSEKSMSDLTTN